MKKSLKTVVSFAAAGAMVLGCVPAFAEAEEATGMANWTAFEENVTLRIPVYDRGAEGVPDVSNNYWTQWVQENFGNQYNITVEYVPITRTDVMTSYSLLAAGEELPTLLTEFDYPKVAQWADDGYLTTIDLDAFAEVAPTYYANMTAEGLEQYSVLGGETYFVMGTRPYYNNLYQYVTFVRMDWLEEVGYDHIPANYDEYLDAMTKIMDAGICEHPGGGSMVTGVGSDLNQKYRTYPLDEEEWAGYGDYNIPSLGWEPNKLLLKRENQKYNMGITDPEYYITDTETAKANFVNGKSYSYGCYCSQSEAILSAFYENFPDGNLAIQGLYTEEYTAADGITESPAYRADNPFGVIVGFSSQASEDEILAAEMYLEWMAQPDNLFTFEWGVEGETFNYNEAGVPVSVSDYNGDYKQGYSYSKDYWNIVTTVRSVGDIATSIACDLPQDLPQNFNQEVLDFYNEYEEVRNKYGASDCQFSVVIEAQSEYQQTLGELYKEYRDELTMCSEEEFDALYDELAQEYWDAGYGEVVEERIAAYQAGNSTTLPEAQKAAE